MAAEEDLIREHRSLARGLARMYAHRISNLVTSDDLLQYGFMRLIRESRSGREFSPRLAIRYGMLDGIRSELSFRSFDGSGGGEGYAALRGLTTSIDAASPDRGPFQVSDGIPAGRLDDIIEGGRLFGVAERCLDARQLDLLRRHLCNEESLTSIGRDYGIGCCRASQIYARALELIRISAGMRGYSA